MEMAQVLLKQAILMAFYMGIGFVLYKIRFINETGVEQMSRVLLYVTVPFVILKAFLADYSDGMLGMILLSFAFGAGCLIFSLLVSALVFRKDPVLRFSSGYPNAGFVAIPLISSVLGDTAVLLASGYTTFINVLQWTYGIYTLTGDRKRMSPKKILQNPVLYAFILGLVLFFLKVRVPDLMREGMNGIAALNCPLAMIVLGTYLARMSFKQMFSGAKGYFCCAMRLAVIPVLTMLILCLVPNDYYLLKMTMLIVAGSPVGANAVLFASLFHLNGEEATRIVSLSTLFSVATLPLLVLLANVVWGI